MADSADLPRRRTAPMGLRERKKRRTRTALIDVAADLCVKQGYDKTTVEQIAAAAEVSPRTFNRYFPSKEAVIAAFADEIDEDMAEALAQQPADITEFEALLRAHLEVFSPTARKGPAAFHRMAVLIQIVDASSTFNTAAFSFKNGVSEHAATTVLAQRMGMQVDDPAVRLLADSWTVLFAASFRGLGAQGGDPIEAQVLCDRLRTTFTLYTRLWSPWHTNGQPPAGASRQ